MTNFSLSHLYMSILLLLSSAFIHPNLSSPQDAVETIELQLSLNTQELDAIETNPDITFVYIPEDVRAILYNLVEDNSKQMPALLSVAPKDIILKALEYSAQTCKNNLEQLATLDAYRKSIESGEAIINVRQEEVTRGSKKKTFCFLTVKKCLRAGSICASGLISAGAVRVGNFLITPAGLSNAAGTSFLNVTGDTVRLAANLEVNNAIVRGSTDVGGDARVAGEAFVRRVRVAEAGFFGGGIGVGTTTTATDIPTGGILASGPILANGTLNTIGNPIEQKLSKIRGTVNPSLAEGSNALVRGAGFTATVVDGSVLGLVDTNVVRVVFGFPYNFTGINAPSIVASVENLIAATSGDIGVRVITNFGSNEFYLAAVNTTNGSFINSPASIRFNFDAIGQIP